MRARTHELILLAVVVSILLGACSRDKHLAETLNRDGNQQYASGDYPKALETYRRAEVLRPDLPAVNSNAANALNRQNDFARALLRANPSDMGAKYNLEVIQRRLDQEEAQQQATGQQSPDQQGQPGQPSEAGESQPSQQTSPSQAEQAGAPQGGAGQQAAGPNGAGANGYTGTAAGQAEALDPNLKRALDQFNQTANVDDALRALDIMAQQERLRQAGSGAPPQTQGRDW